MFNFLGVKINTVDSYRVFAPYHPGIQGGILHY